MKSNYHSGSIINVLTGLKALTVVLSFVLAVSLVSFFSYAEDDVNDSAASFDFIEPSADLPDADVLLGQYIDRRVEDSVTGKSGRSSRKLRLIQSSRYSALSDPAEKDAYEKMQACIRKIAAGESEYAMFSFTGAADLNYNKVLSSLMKDMPYEFYWYDKTVACAVGTRSISDTEKTYTFYMPASVDFANGESIYKAGAEIFYGIDTSRMKSLGNVTAKVTEILDRYASAPDIGKIHGYADEIMALTSYDMEAEQSMNSSQGERFYDNAWQLISVFDCDDSTLTVCEGYAKAFQYLCDRTSFDSGIECITVTSAKHMWNILRMDDGLNYIADLTNCDEAKTEDLFLKGCISGSPDTGYSYRWNNRTLRYVYEPDCLDMFTEEELTMSENDYGSDIVCCPAAAAKCTQAGNSEYWIWNDSYYKDAYCMEETSLDDTVTPAAGHKWTTYYKSLDYNKKKCRICGRVRTVSKVVTDRPAISIRRAAGSKGALSISWKKPSLYKLKRMTGVEIQYSTSPKFTDKTSSVTKVKKSVLSKKIKGLKNRKNYYIRIRTYKNIDGKKHVSEWSNVLTVRTK